jgi:hypothetical protein
MCTFQVSSQESAGAGARYSSTGPLYGPPRQRTIKDEGLVTVCSAHLSEDITTTRYNKLTYMALPNELSGKVPVQTTSLRLAFGLLQQDSTTFKTRKEWLRQPQGPAIACFAGLLELFPSENPMPLNYRALSLLTLQIIREFFPLRTSCSSLLGPAIACFAHYPNLFLSKNLPFTYRALSMLALQIIQSFSRARTPCRSLTGPCHCLLCKFSGSFFPEKTSCCFPTGPCHCLLRKLCSTFSQ